MSNRLGSVPSQLPLPSKPSQPRRSRSHIPLPSDVIIIPSDEEDCQSMPHRKRARLRGEPSHVPSSSSSDVIVISDDDAPRSKKSASDPGLEMKLKVLEKENARLRNEVTQAQTHSSSEIAKQVEFYKVLANILDDISSCEICTMRMWTPNTLRCGHSFCQGCLQHWFEALLTKSKAVNNAMLQWPQLPVESQIQAVLEAHQPTYTCPACRVPAKERPSEIYSLKRMVEAYAETLGETAPKKVLPGSGSREPASPWDRFFPATSLS